MNEYSWIEHMLQAEGFAISPKMHWFLHASDETISPYDLEEEEYAIRGVEALYKQFPSLKCVPFARRLDRDDLFVVVLQDSAYKRGQVLLVDIENVHKYCIDESYPSLDAWVSSVWVQLEDWRAARP